jgi:hypothetical protein
MATSCIFCLSTPSGPGKAFQELVIKLPLGSRADVRTLAPNRFEFVCALAPYQNEIHGYGELDSAVNDYLRETAYVAEEGEASVLSIDQGQISLLSFHTNENLDYMGPEEFSRYVQSSFKDFKSAYCAEYAQAKVLKFTFSNRTYITLGIQK